jgi:autotransporter-associated beta strand protein
MNGGSTNRWNLTGSNSYTGATTISSGALGISQATSLGAIDVGTTVSSGAALFLRNTGTVTFAAEPLTIAGRGPAASARGALRQVGMGTSTWTAPITANAAAPVRIGADAGSLTITSDITTTGSSTLEFETTGTITVNGNISGSVGLSKVSGVGGPGTNVLTLAGSDNTYTGATTVSVGILSLTGTLANTSAVTVAAGSALRGTGSINPAALATISGTLGGGATDSSIGTLSLGGLSMTATSTFSLDLNTTLGTNDRVNAAGNLSLDSGNATTLVINDLLANATPLALGTAFTFIDYGGTWNGGLFTFGGTPVADDTGMFTVGLNTYSIDYNGGVASNDVQLVVVPEPTAIASLFSGLGLLVGLQRLRRRR